MTTAIIIVIFILVLSVVLFFFIRKIANVSDINSDVYTEEGVITDFSEVNSKPENYIIDENTIKQSNLKAKFVIIISYIYKLFNQQLQRFSKLKLEYQKREAEKIKAKEQAIKEAIRLDKEAQDLEFEHQNKLENDTIDTSYFEIEARNTANEKSNQNINPKPLITAELKVNPEVKATDFVEQLLSEVDAISEVSPDTDISDTYYYEYMEKRYISRIVKNSKDIEAYKKLGDLYVDMRNYKDALDAFEYVLKLKPNDTISVRRVKDISNRLKK